jgi:flagellar biosynthesis anti-sigma factor FlgM
MRIDNNGIPTIREPRAGRVPQTQASSDVKRSSAPVNLSTRAEDIRTAGQGLSKLPDVRQERIDQIKAELAEGRYIVDPKAIAEKMHQMFMGIDV